MPLSYPIAATARAALDSVEDARTIAEARERAGAQVVLVSEWLRPSPADTDEIKGKADAGLTRGFVQIYEDAKGRPVIAVTFWKPASPKSVGAKSGDKPVRGAVKGTDRPSAAEDDTDDLYFARPSSRTKKRRQVSDPNQLDLFRGQSGGGDTGGPSRAPSPVVGESGGD